MDVGTRFKHARERRGFSLREVADRTKFSVFHLDALERGEFKRLPSGIFGRSFIRNYAIEVGLDPEELVRQAIEQWPEAAPQSLDEPISRASDGRVPLRTRLVAVVGALTFLAAAAAGAYFWVTSQDTGKAGGVVITGGPR